MITLELAEIIKKDIQANPEYCAGTNDEILHALDTIIALYNENNQLRLDLNYQSYVNTQNQVLMSHKDSF